MMMKLIWKLLLATGNRDWQGLSQFSISPALQNHPHIHHQSSSESTSPAFCILCFHNLFIWEWSNPGALPPPKCFPLTSFHPPKCFPLKLRRYHLKLLTRFVAKLLLWYETHFKFGSYQGLMSSQRGYFCHPICPSCCYCWYLTSQEFQQQKNFLQLL